MPLKTLEERRKYQREWMRKRRQSWIQANGPCQNCGSWDNLEVDHIDPSTKSMNPASIWSRAEEIRAAELSKCQVLCYDCHKSKTVDDGNFSCGSNNGSARLTEEDVLYIRGSSLSYRELGEKFGMNPSYIGRIKRRERWRHI